MLDGASGLIGVASGGGGSGAEGGSLGPVATLPEALGADEMPLPAVGEPPVVRRWGITLGVEAVVTGFDGNAFDATLLAAVLALHSVTLPAWSVEARGEPVLRIGGAGSVVLRATAAPLLPPAADPVLLVPASFVAIRPAAVDIAVDPEDGDANAGGGAPTTAPVWVADPTAEEEDLAAATCAIVVAVPLTRSPPRGGGGSGGSKGGVAMGTPAVVSVRQEGGVGGGWEGTASGNTRLPAAADDATVAALSTLALARAGELAPVLVDALRS
jgi:hypothetical protein